MSVSYGPTYIRFDIVFKTLQTLKPAPNMLEHKKQWNRPLRLDNL